MNGSWLPPYECVPPVPPPPPPPGTYAPPARERIDVGALARGVLARVLHDEIHNLFAVPRVEPVVLQEELRGRVRVIATVERKLERGRALLDVDVEDEVVLDARVFLLPAASAADARDLPQSFPRRRRGGPRVRGDGPGRLLDHLSRAVGRAGPRQRGRRFGLNLRLSLGESRARARPLRGASSPPRAPPPRPRSPWTRSSSTRARLRPRNTR